MSTFAVLLVSSYLQIKLLTDFYTKFLKIFYILKLLAVMILNLQKTNAKELESRDPYLSFKKSRSMFASNFFMFGRKITMHYGSV